MSISATWKKLKSETKIFDVCVFFFYMREAM